MENDQPLGGSSSLPYKYRSGSNIGKPPQRGLGVAQLEKIRLEAQMATFGYISEDDPSYPSVLRQMQAEHMRLQSQFHQAALLAQSMPFGQYPGSNFMMGNNGQHMEIASQPTPANWWNSYNNNNAMMAENNQNLQPQGMVTRHLLGHIGHTNNNMVQNPFPSTGFRGPSIQQMLLEANNENLEEVDLELKL